MQGSLIIISSPSGGGKGTLIRSIREGVSNLAYSVSHTTRPIRDGEADGVDYNFVSTETFETLIENGDFLEYAKVHGNYYGTSRSYIDSQTKLGNDVILEIDVQGAAIVREQVPEAVSVFILPPSFEVLRTRLASRNTESDEQLDLRLTNAADEVRRFKEFDYVIINDDLEVAVDHLRSVVLANRLLRVRQKEVIRGILTTFDNQK